jgi:hypothetical protein
MASLLKISWLKGQALPTCACGWSGTYCRSDREAKEQHKAHVRDDCPIGAR